MCCVPLPFGPLSDNLDGLFEAFRELVVIRLAQMPPLRMKSFKTAHINPPITTMSKQVMSLSSQDNL